MVVLATSATAPALLHRATRSGRSESAIYFEEHLAVHLTPALIALAQARPVDPIPWLARYLLSHKPAPRLAPPATPPIASAMPTALCRTGSDEEKAAFLQNEWMPFFLELQEALSSTHTRHVLGVSLEEVLPPQPQWELWTSRCRELTAQWHGRANISAIYECLIACSAYDGVSPYKFTDVPGEWSEDGWVRSLDGNVRASFGKKARELEAAKAKRTGGMGQSAGESAIDNTVLPNIVTREESAVLLAGKKIKEMLVAQIAKRQLRYLSRLTKNQVGPLRGVMAPLALKEDALRTALQLIKNRELESSGVNGSSSPWLRLRDAGKIISSFGQLSSERCADIDRFLRSQMGSGSGVDGSDEGDELAKFVSFIRSNPGRLYLGDRKRHDELLVGVMVSPKYAIIKRSTLEGFTNHRYLLMEWQRTQKLVQVEEDGSLKTLREAGAKEGGRLRKNGFCYFESHGLGLTSSGLTESRGTFAFELGAAKVADEGAKLGNWFASDFEKVLCEAEALNGAGGAAYSLPGESSHEVCQNPRAASSIGATQHTQISRGGCEMWPVLRLMNMPVQCAQLGCQVDLVQVGHNADAVMLLLACNTPTHPPIVDCLVSLRTRLATLYGGRMVDFNLVTSPRGDGAFVIAFAPLAALVWDNDKGGYVNPSTGEILDQARLPCATVDSSQGKGNMLTYSPEAHALAMKGEPIIRMLYDFNRIPQAQRHVLAYFVERYGIELPVPSGPTATVCRPAIDKVDQTTDLF